MINKGIKHEDTFSTEECVTLQLRGAQTLVYADDIVITTINGERK